MTTGASSIGGVGVLHLKINNKSSNKNLNLPIKTAHFAPPKITYFKIVNLQNHSLKSVGEY